MDLKIPFFLSELIRKFNSLLFSFSIYVPSIFQCFSSFSYWARFTSRNIIINTIIFCLTTDLFNTNASLFIFNNRCSLYLLFNYHIFKLMWSPTLVFILLQMKSSKVTLIFLISFQMPIFP